MDEVEAVADGAADTDEAVLDKWPATIRARDAAPGIISCGMGMRVADVRGGENCPSARLNHRISRFLRIIGQATRKSGHCGDATGSLPPQRECLACEM